MTRRRPEPEEPPRAAVVVIGAGAAGVAAARAARAGLDASSPDGRVVLVGDARPGGGSRLVADGGVLLDCAMRGLDWHATLAHLRAVRATVEDRCREAALRAERIDVVRGRARLLGGGRVAVEGKGPAPSSEVLAARIVIATGDEERAPELTGLADARHFTAATVLGLADLPPSLVVLGGGGQGCELAQAFARFGVQVTLVEAGERLLPGEHPDAVAIVTQALRADGVRVFTGSRAVSVAPTLDGGAWVGIQGGGDVAAEGLVLATGRRPAVRGLDLHAAGVTLGPDGWVRVDERLATTGSGVLAVGRVTGLLPHGGTDPVMARVAGLNAVSRRPRARWSPSGLARVVRTDPPIGAVGTDPADAASVPGARVTSLPMAALDPALLGAAPGGLVSLVAGPRPARRARTPWSGRAGSGRAASGRAGSGRAGAGSVLLGVSIVGPQAGELAGLAALAVRAGMTVEELADAPLSSRTWAVALQHAAAGFLAPDNGLEVRRPGL